MNYLALSIIVLLASSAHARDVDVVATQPEKVVPYPIVESSVPVSYGLMYPAKAMEAEVEGGAVVTCTVAVTGRLSNCECFQETQEGLGFCSAAIRIAQIWVRVDLERYGLKDGDKVAYRIDWRLS